MDNEHTPARGAEQLAKLKRLLVDHSKLTRWGYLNPSDPDYQKARADSRSSKLLKEFCAALAFLSAGAPGVRTDKRQHSYTFKHHAERWGATQRPEWIYVSNGAVIAAALSLGWAVQRYKINAWIRRPAANAKEALDGE